MTRCNQEKGSMEIGEEFRPNLLYTYSFWHLFLSPRQRYLGRCYIWWIDRFPREGENMRYDNLSDDALLETKVIYRDFVNYCSRLGYLTEPYGVHFRVNGPLPLANERNVHKGHMHMHLIPRTDENFVCEHIGVKTDDEDFEKMYISSNHRSLEAWQMQTLREVF